MIFEQYLLDTNVVSELVRLKSRRCNPSVAAWFSITPTNSMFINSIVLMEQQMWVNSAAHRKDFLQAERLQRWVAELQNIFKDRILPIDNDIALRCADLHIPNKRPQHDALIAATALTHDLVLVTENIKDFQNIDGLRILNPFI